jgi:hypothetical protein
MLETFNSGAGCRDRLGIIDEVSPEDFPEGGRVCTRIGKSRITATVAPNGHSHRTAMRVINRDCSKSIISLISVFVYAM